MIAALFDMDNTLLLIDTGMSWTRFLYRRGELPASMVAKVVYWSALYKLAVLDMEAVVARLVADLAGDSEAEMIAKCDQSVPRGRRGAGRPGRARRDRAPPCGRSHDRARDRFDGVRGAAGRARAWRSTTCSRPSSRSTRPGASPASRARCASAVTR